MTCPDCGGPDHPCRQKYRPDQEAVEAALWPDRMDMIRQLREAVGLFAGAMPITPRQAWEEALLEARRLGAVAQSAKAAP